MTTFRVAYIPEHFSTPLFQAEKQGYYKSQDLTIEFVPVIEGTGRLIKLLNSKEIDFAIGLTEGFVADIAKGNDVYKIIGSFVESPLCWAISTGYDRQDITKASDLQSKKIGVSRIGSGSYIMSFVLGLQLGFQQPFFEAHPTLSNFKNLRDSVNLKANKGEGLENSDAFMWEHFTSKKYYDNKEIKKIGVIYTPWPSWVITCRDETISQHKPAVINFLNSLNQGIDYFNNNQEDAINHIATNLDYSAEDAKEWLKTVKFNQNVSKLDWDRVVNKTAEVLKTAGVLTDDNSTIESRLKSGVIDITI